MSIPLYPQQHLFQIKMLHEGDMGQQAAEMQMSLMLTGALTVSLFLASNSTELMLQDTDWVTTLLRMLAKPSAMEYNRSVINIIYAQYEAYVQFWHTVIHGSLWLMIGVVMNEADAQIRPGVKSA